MTDVDRAIADALAIAKQRGFLRRRGSIEEFVRERVVVITEMRQYMGWAEIGATLKAAGVDAHPKTIEVAYRKAVGKTRVARKAPARSKPPEDAKLVPTPTKPPLAAVATPQAVGRTHAADRKGEFE